MADCRYSDSVNFVRQIRMEENVMTRRKCREKLLEASKIIGEVMCDSALDFVSEGYSEKDVIICELHIARDVLCEALVTDWWEDEE